MQKSGSSELKKAYEVYIKAGELEKALECVNFLYKDEGDYDSVLAFRRKLTRRFQTEKKARYMDLARASYMLTAQDNFDDYMVAMEWERPVKQKFYVPRRKKLLPIVQAMQKLADDKLDMLGVSAPPGIGKTALGDFYMTFRAGNHPDLAMIMASHSNSILNDNYNECLRMCSGDEYTWGEIFPTHSVRKTNAADLKIDIDKPHKFSTFQFGSVAQGSGLAGRIRAMQLLYCDDLIPNIEVAMSKDRLDGVWNRYGVDLKQRVQGDICKELHIATRWSVHDVIGRLERMNENNDRALFLRFPALNSKGESNYDYGGSIGWTTKKYEEIRDTMDEASWRALYLCEPIEREGLLYPSDEIQYYFDLPVNEPDSVLAVCDTKDRGTDYCVMVVAYQYGDNFYIENFLYNNKTPEVTVPLIVDRLMDYKVKMIRFESNSAGGQIAVDVQKEIEARKGITSISTKYSTGNKETRIIVDSAWVKKHCLFKDPSRQDHEYKQAFMMLTGYSMAVRNKNDDVPDAMSMLANFVQSFETNVLTIGRRWF